MTVGTAEHTPPPPGALPRASLGETVGVAAGVLLPLVARGLIARRPRVVALAERVDADRRAVRRLQRLRTRHGDGPVLLRLPRRTVALVLGPEDVRRLLQGSPTPFATATVEKRFALSHFQPQGALISDAAARSVRRPFNETVLQWHRPLHSCTPSFVEKVGEEADVLAAEALAAGVLDWDRFITAWWRIVRRIVLGDGARDDAQLSDLLTALRRDANWSYLRPRRHRLRRRFQARLDRHLDRAEPGSLAELVAATPAAPGTAPSQQVPQWLFAFDPAGMACFRALALLAAHPAQARRARAEPAPGPEDGAGELPLLRACVLESLRLWPTTPALLRDSTAATSWDPGVLPAGASLLVFAPLLHRDGLRLAFADRFAPEAWLDDRGGLDPGAAARWGLVPFSGGPAACPGQDLVLLTASTLLARLLSHLDLQLDPPRRLGSGQPLPGTLSPYRLRFAVTAAIGRA